MFMWSFGPAPLDLGPRIVMKPGFWEMLKIWANATRGAEPPGGEPRDDEGGPLGVEPASAEGASPCSH